MRQSIRKLNKLNLKFRLKHLKFSKNLKDSLKCLKNSRISLTSQSKY